MPTRARVRHVRIYKAPDSNYGLCLGYVSKIVRPKSGPGSGDPVKTTPSEAEIDRKGSGSGVYYLLVDSVREGGPADQSGIRKGDRIVSINKESVRGREFRLLMQDLSASSSQVQLGVLERESTSSHRSSSKGAGGVSRRYSSTQLNSIQEHTVPVNSRGSSWRRSSAQPDTGPSTGAPSALGRGVRAASAGNLTYRGERRLSGGPSAQLSCWPREGSRRGRQAYAMSQEEVFRDGSMEDHAFETASESLRGSASRSSIAASHTGVPLSSSTEGDSQRKSSSGSPALDLSAAGASSQLRSKSSSSRRGSSSSRPRSSPPSRSGSSSKEPSQEPVEGNRRDSLSQSTTFAEAHETSGATAESDQSNASLRYYCTTSGGSSASSQPRPTLVKGRKPSVPSAKGELYSHRPQPKHSAYAKPYSDPRSYCSTASPPSQGQAHRHPGGQGAQGGYAGSHSLPKRRSIERSYSNTSSSSAYPQYEVSVSSTRRSNDAVKIPVATLDESPSPEDVDHPLFDSHLSKNLSDSNASKGDDNGSSRDSPASIKVSSGYQETYSVNASGVRLLPRHKVSALENRGPRAQIKRKYGKSSLVPSPIGSKEQLEMSSDAYYATYHHSHRPSTTTSSRGSDHASLSMPRKTHHASGGSSGRRPNDRDGERWHHGRSDGVSLQPAKLTEPPHSRKQSTDSGDPRFHKSAPSLTLLGGDVTPGQPTRVGEHPPPSAARSARERPVFTVAPPSGGASSVAGSGGYDSYPRQSRHHRGQPPNAQGTNRSLDWRGVSGKDANFRRPFGSGAHNAPLYTLPSEYPSAQSTPKSEGAGDGTVVLRPKADDWREKAARRVSYMMATSKQEAVENQKSESGSKSNLRKFQKLIHGVDKSIPSIKESAAGGSAAGPSLIPRANLTITKSGLLTIKILFLENGKKGDKSWRMYGVVMSNEIMYIVKRDSAPITEVYTEEEGFSVRGCHMNIAYNHHNSKKKNIFKLSTVKGGEYVVQAENSTEMKGWVAAIQEVSAPITEEDKLGRHRLMEKVMNTRPTGSSGAGKKKLISGLSMRRTPGSPDLRSAKPASGGNKKVARKVKQYVPPGEVSAAEMGPDGSPGIFGHHLHECVPAHDNEMVPFVVEECTKAIEEIGLEFIGIYRVPGNKASVNALQKEFNKGSIDTTNEKWKDVNVLSSLLKLFFRKLPDSLMTRGLYGTFVTANDTPDQAQRLIQLKDLVHQLPEHNYETLRHLITHLSRVAAHGSKNLMDPRNLAIVFGPTLMRSPDESMAAMVKDMSAQCRIVESLITYCKWFFSPVEDPVPSVEEQESVAPISNTMQGMAGDIEKIVGGSGGKVSSDKLNQQLAASAAAAALRAKSAEAVASAPDDDGTEHGFSERNIDEEVALRKHKIQEHQEAAAAAASRASEPTASGSMPRSAVRRRVIVSNTWSRHNSMTPSQRRLHSDDSMLDTDDTVDEGPPKDNTGSEGQSAEALNVESDSPTPPPIPGRKSISDSNSALSSDREEDMVYMSLPGDSKPPLPPRPRHSISTDMSSAAAGSSDGPEGERSATGFGSSVFGGGGEDDWYTSKPYVGIHSTRPPDLSRQINYQNVFVPTQLPRKPFGMHQVTLPVHKPSLGRKRSALSQQNSPDQLSPVSLSSAPHGPFGGSTTNGNGGMQRPGSLDSMMDFLNDTGAGASCTSDDSAGSDGSTDLLANVLKSIEKLNLESVGSSFSRPSGSSSTDSPILTRPSATPPASFLSRASLPAEDQQPVESHIVSQRTPLSFQNPSLHKRFPTSSPSVGIATPTKPEAKVGIASRIERTDIIPSPSRAPLGHGANHNFNNNSTSTTTVVSATGNVVSRTQAKTGENPSRQVGRACHRAMSFATAMPHPPVDFDPLHKAVSLPESADVVARIVQQKEASLNQNNNNSICTQAEEANDQVHAPAGGQGNGETTPAVKRREMADERKRLRRRHTVAGAKDLPADGEPRDNGVNVCLLWERMLPLATGAASAGLTGPAQAMSFRELIHKEKYRSSFPDLGQSLAEVRQSLRGMALESNI